MKRWQIDLIATSNDAEKVRKSQDSANRTYTILRSALNSAFRDGAVQSDAAWRRVRPFPNVTRAREVFLTAYLVDVLQRVGQHPAVRVAELTPRLWRKIHFAGNPLRSDLYGLPA